MAWNIGPQHLPSNNPDLTPEERHALAVKAGQHSAQTRHRKKLLRECAREILDAEMTDDDEVRQVLSERGLETTEGMGVLFAMLGRARKGDVEAARFLRDTSGQKPSDQIEIGGIEGQPLTALDVRSMTNEQLAEMIAAAEEEADTQGV